MTGDDRQVEQPAPAQAPVAEAPPPAKRWRLYAPSQKTVRHVAIEVLIVALGVFLALGVDQLRQHWGRVAEAQETRELLQTELRRSLANIELAMKGLAGFYPQAVADPEQAPALVAANRGGAPLMFDAAYEVALQTGALRYLDAEERKTISEAYVNQRVLDAKSDKYLDVVEELAAWPSGRLDDADDARARAHQTRRWVRAAELQFVALCRQLARSRIAASFDYPDNYEVELCRNVSPATTDIDALIAGVNRQKPVPAAAPVPD